MREIIGRIMPMFRKTSAVALALAATALTAQTPPPKADPQPFGTIGAPAGSGAYPAVVHYLPAMPNNAFYHPATMPRAKLPIVMWGNGGCRDDSLSAAAFLREVASHGYFIVVAGPPRTERAPGPPPAQAQVMLNTPPDRQTQLARRGPDATSPEHIVAGLDWAVTQNADPKSPLFGRLDTRQIAVMGHSCGGLQAMRISSDPRIKATVLFNSGVFADAVEGVSALSVSKAELAKLHAPIAYIIGGPTDIAWPQAIDDTARITHVPLFFAHSNIGHGGTFWTAPNGGDYGRIATAWLDWHLKRKASAGAMFRGRNCGLCKTAGWTVPRVLD
jgi:dienelactone hydrolase